MRRRIVVAIVVVGFVALTGLPAASPANDAGESSAPNAIYAKVILPMKEPDSGKNPVVESWIAEKLRKRGQTELRAVTPWIRLAEKGEKNAPVWDAVVDGKGWGCPVGGRVKERTGDGKVKVSLPGWAPVALKVKGTTLPAEVGSRGIAEVEDGKAYVALFVGLPAPPASEDASPSHP